MYLSGDRLRQIHILNFIMGGILYYGKEQTDR